MLEAQNTFKKEGLSIAHYDLRFVKPLDENMLHNIFKKYNSVITIEDGCVQGGFGSSVLEFMATNNYTCSVKLLGIPDKFIDHGTQQELHEECGFDKKAIVKSVHKILAKNVVNQVG